ncbi:MAG TPA: ABC transporter, partial [Stellaceae bacterium]|nr:ABC transporter [Stellaceae bacterium]
YGTTLLLITHDRDLARRCDRTVHMADGRIIDAADVAGDLTVLSAR